MALLVIFKSISAGNWLFLSISGGLEGLFDFFDSLHHHALARHSPANSRRTTKQFLSRPHSLKLFLSDGAELLATNAAGHRDYLSPIGRLRSQ
jgi:hypothetical protein